MSQFVRNPLRIIIIVTVILLVALMLFTSGNRQEISVPESILGQIIMPVQKTMYSIATSVYSFFTGIEDHLTLKQDYELLKQEIAQMEKQLLEMEELKKQNERLKKLVDYADQKQELVVTGALVIGKNPGNWFNIITIDKGKNDGVAVNMAVVTDDGLVGRIIEVGANWSKVRTIVDGQSSVSGIVQRNRDNGLVKGNNSFTDGDGMCRMIYLPEDTDVTPGDKIITSGLGDIFPKGIYIGEVQEVIKEKRELFKTAIIKPGADFQRLEEVLVIRSVRGAEGLE